MLNPLGPLGGTQMSLRGLGLEEGRVGHLTSRHFPASRPTLKSVLGALTPLNFPTLLSLTVTCSVGASHRTECEKVEDTLQGKSEPLGNCSD